MNNYFGCVDIVTECGIIISVWAESLPDAEDLVNDGPLPALDLVYPVPIPSVEVAVLFARSQLGWFEVKETY